MASGAGANARRETQMAQRPHEYAVEQQVLQCFRGVTAEAGFSGAQVFEVQLAVGRRSVETKQSTAARRGVVFEMDVVSR
jgi:hypothetical protein